jgi:hypothetical protein
MWRIGKSMHGVSNLQKFRSVSKIAGAPPG